MEPELLAVYLEESHEQLATLLSELSAIGQEGQSESRIDALFRLAHTFKGNSSIVGLHRLASLANSVEEVLDLIRCKRLRGAPEVFSALYRAVVALRVRLQRSTVGDDSFDEASLAVFAELRRTVVSIGAPASSGLLPETKGMPAAAQSNFGQAVAPLPSAVFESGQALFARFSARAVELGELLGKPVDVVIRDDGVVIDELVRKRLSDALLHLIRNALDHGIETSEVRRTLGKSRRGRLVISARQLPDALEIVVQDDGAGLNRSRIIEAARRHGLALAADAADEEIWKLIFAPAFSTAQEVSTVSGRGVGLDVVRTAVLGLGGSLQVQSEAGRGTRFVMRFPMGVV